MRKEKSVSSIVQGSGSGGIAYSSAGSEASSTASPLPQPLPALPYPPSPPASLTTNSPSALTNSNVDVNVNLDFVLNGVSADIEIDAIPIPIPGDGTLNIKDLIMQPPPSPNTNIPLDPALAMYPATQYYTSYSHPQHQQHQQHHGGHGGQMQHPQHIPQHLATYSSPSSQGSDTLGTPPTEHNYPSANLNGKRPSSVLSGGGSGDVRAKKMRKDPSLGMSIVGDDIDDGATAHSPGTEKDEGGTGTKPKSTRGSRACTVCRRLKMKCVGAEQGPPCKRCISGNHECIFEESNRGKRSSKKHELLTRSLRKMEKTLDTVLRSIGNPSIASGMISRSPSPSAQTQSTSTQVLLGRSPSPGAGPSGHTGPSSSAGGATLGAAAPASRQPPGSPKLHSLPDNSLNPLGLLAEASLANRRAHVGAKRSIGSLGNTGGAGGAAGVASKIAEAQDGQNLGVASDNYFKPGPMTILPLRRLYIERQIQPEMLSFVSTDEVVVLFDIYFDHISMHCSLLDRNFHTPSLVCSRSPFLLTTICSIASKFYTARPDLHPRLTELAKKLAFSVPAKGYKSVEIVQAYLLLSLWGCGAVERYEQDKTWLLLGMAIRLKGILRSFHGPCHSLYHSGAGDDQANTSFFDSATNITSFSDNLLFPLLSNEVKNTNHNDTQTFRRMATDLNLHRKTAVTSPDTAEGKARDIEVHNRERTWILCFCLDRSFSAQMGKPHSIKEDYIIRHAEQWSRSSVSVPSDSSICAYAELQRVLSRSLDFLYGGTDSASGLQTHCDYLLVIKSFESQLYAWREKWYQHGTWEGETNTAKTYKQYIATFYFNYAALVLNSFGLQNALERSSVDIGHFFGRVHSSAMACAMLVRDHLGPSGYMKYSPDSHFVQTSYAVLSLLKLVRPEFQAFLEDEQKTLSLVKDVAEVLEGIAASTTHTPALYAAFLRALISAKLEPQQGGSQTDEPKQDDVEGDSPTDIRAARSTAGIYEPPTTDTTSPSSSVINNPNDPTSSSHPADATTTAITSPDVNAGVATMNPNTQLQQTATNAASAGYYNDPQNYYMNEFHFESEMGPVVDMSTFPPTMAAPPNPQEDTTMLGGLTMENILSSGFWDSMLVPGYNSMDGLSGGFVFGAGGSGLITPRFGLSPMQSGANTPSRGHAQQSLTQSTINAAFNNHHHGQLKDGIKIDS
ncbi:hypothetical protein NP233_g143 [Leucocoprinus birnbaumii]|uniref:Zn(2)-C6 fungal-type domain-containing protein n=1 Tax=Leucocoprinus birnbaumii TaxID=56174 RepID=A0AAD5W756_9AGAR|nr:hypothetical protein NP233_g143 [Leucocoprinus birnbaumii]